MDSNIINVVLGDRAKRKAILWIIIIVVAALLTLIVFNLLFGGSTSFSRLLNWVEPDKYQAVFLSNGQVYFGRVADINRETLVLEDIYYLQMSRNLQTGDEEERLSADDFSLIKLGNEIHGPEDKMNINLEHVLFVENLKDDSRVVEAIGKYRSEK